MNGPAKSGAFIYAKEVHSLSDFYIRLLGLVKLYSSSELVVLNSAGLQVVVHSMPPEIASNASVTKPPALRQTAIKLFFSVDSINSAAELAKELGGQVFPEVWHGPGFKVSNACDPEGNMFHIREFTP